MTRREMKLHASAEEHWPGSGDDIVVVYRAWIRQPESLWAATKVSDVLRFPTERQRCLAKLRQRLPRSDRKGPKRDRETAADTALDRLEERAGGGS